MGTCRNESRSANFSAHCVSCDDLLLLSETRTRWQPQAIPGETGSPLFPEGGDRPSAGMALAAGAIQWRAIRLAVTINNAGSVFLLR